MLIKKNEEKTDVHKKLILVNVGSVEKRIVILSEGRVQDFFMERSADQSYAGSIYKAKVVSIVKGIEAAFLDIGHEKNAFLHVGDILYQDDEMITSDDDEEIINKRKTKSVENIKNLLKNGQEIMVQVAKEAMGTKGARVSGYVSIPGRYIVLTPFDQNIGISKRIKDVEKRKKIREMIAELGLDKNTGCIVRTMAENIDQDALRSEMKYLINLWKNIKAKYESSKAPVTLYEEYGAVLRMVRDRFTEDIDELIIDSKEEFSRIIKFLKAFNPALSRKVIFYNNKTPMFQKYGVNKQIEEIFDRKVALKKGGSLVIEQTESLVAIDVNTGSFTKSANLEQTAFKTNIEAAREIPRQLMLRDMGGIIIIDFIDMAEKKHRDEVFRTLQDELKHDKARISLRSISQFGVVEMTRQRMRKSIEGTSHMECPYCTGRGTVKKPETIAIEAVRNIDKKLSEIKSRKKHIRVTVHPDVHALLTFDQAKMLRDVQKKYRCSIDLRHDISTHIESILILEN
ncbi:MAG: Rne/Rng family ribonuclease [Candidatus Omnitrophica bacterium]|nr:Rne/Rng family ribonuclease [Candidatus Omnitrophota bacterium]